MKSWIPFLLLVTLCYKGFSQDPLFTNVNQSLVYLNPSFAGTNGLVRNQTSYRNQWPNLSGNYLTYYNGFDAYFSKIKSGISLSFMHDEQADKTITTDVFNLAYAYSFVLNNKLKIIPSVELGYFNKILDLTKLTFGSQINPQGPFTPQPPFAGNKLNKQNINFS